MLFESHRTVRFADTDAAGVVYFARLFEWAHDSYEAMMAEHGCALERLLHDGTVLIPIAHAEADYKEPLRLGDKLSIQIALAQRKTSSFSLNYAVQTEDGRTAASLCSVHVVIDRQSGRPCPIPEQISNALS